MTSVTIPNSRFDRVLVDNQVITSVDRQLIWLLRQRVVQMQAV